MLTDNLLRRLPDDPELAYVELVERLDNWLTEYNRGSQDFSGERKYAETLRAFADEYDLEVPFRRFDVLNFDTEGDWWKQFAADVEYAKARYSFRHKLGSRMLLGSSVS